MDLDIECPICFEHQVCKMLFNKCNHHACMFCFDKMNKQICPVCCASSIVTKLYYPVSELKVMSPYVATLYDKIMNLNIVQDIDITQLLIEYVKWLKMIAENVDELIPSILIHKLWILHSSDEDSYIETCNKMGIQRLFWKVNMNIMSVINTKKCYEKKYGNDMLGTKFWKFDDPYDIGMIIGDIYVHCLDGSSLTVPFSSTMTYKQLKMIIENINDRSYSDSLRLMFCGRQLFNDVILSSFGIKVDFTIHMTLPLRGD